MWVVIAVALSLGSALTAAGVRGRRTDDHPLCRRCRFDLTGRPDTAERRCPECGADLSPTRAVVVGHRQRRVGMLAGGLTVLAAVTVVAGTVEWGRAGHVNWLRYAPESYLIHEASSTDRDRQRPALVELIARSADGRLSPGGWAGVVRAGLAYQADRTKAWGGPCPQFENWGDLIELAWAAGHVTEGQWKQYATQAVETAVTFRFRPQIQWGDPLPFRRGDGFRGDRRAWRSVLSFDQDDSLQSRTRLYWPEIGSTIGDDEQGVVVEPPSIQGMPANQGPDVDCDAFVAAPWITAQFTEGRHTVHVLSRVTVSCDGRDRTGPTVRVLADVAVDTPLAFSILPPGQPSMRMVTSLPSDVAIRNGLQCTVRRAGLNAGEVWIISDLNLDLSAAPIAADVFLRHEGRTELIGNLIARHPNPIVLKMVGGQFELFACEKVDVVLRGSRELAAKTIDLQTVWDGEVVYKDVPVK